MKIKTIDINANEWFDKVNGSSYFSAVITLNFGMKAEKHFPIPFEYGYGEHYIDASNHYLIENKYIDGRRNENGSYTPLWQYARDNNIILRTSKKENCLKSELIKG